VPEDEVPEDEVPEDDAEDAELEVLDELLLPQPASASRRAATVDRGINRRISCRTVPGDKLRRR
jgi:hypothetical protein